MPFGLVDFIEVLQGGRLNTEIWYTFLNLGYRVLPVAGADFPYFGPTLPGVERTYVRLDGPFSADAWFAAFRAETATTLVERWQEQRSRLEPRVAEADRRYRELLERFRRTGSGAAAGRP